MTRRPARRESPLVYAAVGASLLAIPASAAAFDSPPSSDASTPALKARVARHKIAYGHRVVVVGHAPSSDAGQTVTLQFEPGAGGGWRQIASGWIEGDGNFRLVARLGRSGWLKATTQAPSGGASTGSATAFASGATTTSSSPQHVAVAAAVRLGTRAINDLGVRTISVRGRLLPGLSGRWIRLEARRSDHWVGLGQARTRPGGAFALRYHPPGSGQERLRIRFAGDGANAAVWSRTVILTVYRQAMASWYDDGGATACGFHAYYGVANLSLPCGTAVSFSYHGRTVRAVVDDRGPYVAGRTWDLNQNTASALGFGGVDAVWSSR